MISDLPAAAFAQATSVFDALSHNVVVPSILAGYTRGAVLVDNVQAPRRGCLWNQQDTLLLGGSPEDGSFARDWHDVLRAEIIPDARARHIPGFTLYIDGDAWRPHLEPLLADINPAWSRRYAFRCDGLAPEWREALPPGYALQRLDASFLADTTREHHHELVSWILSFWPTTRQFLKRGVGYCIRHGKTLASWCLSVYAGDSALELGVATVVAHRNQGLATVVTSAAVNDCLQRGIIPHWQCDATNQPSLAVARKAGFVRARADHVYRLSI